MVIADCENGLLEGTTLNARKELADFVFTSQGALSPCGVCANRVSAGIVPYRPGARPVAAETGPHCAGIRGQSEPIAIRAAAKPRQWRQVRPHASDFMALWAAVALQ